MATQLPPRCWQRIRSRPAFLLCVLAMLPLALAQRLAELADPHMQAGEYCAPVSANDFRDPSRQSPSRPYVGGLLSCMKPFSTNPVSAAWRAERSHTRVLHRQLCLSPYHGALPVYAP